MGRKVRREPGERGPIGTGGDWGGKRNVLLCGGEKRIEKTKRRGKGRKRFIQKNQNP